MGQKKLEREQGEETKRSRWVFRGKTVWDWMALLIVPLVLVVIGLIFTMLQDARQQDLENQRAEQAQKIEDQRAAAERELAEQRAQDEALQSYLDQMSQLMLERKLLEAEPGDPVHTLAQARTSTVIFRLDAEHNESVTRFLGDSGLAGSADASVSLLRGIVLEHATLSNADLSAVDLRDADLSGAGLSGANLLQADLSGANLNNANLSFADLDNANLSSAHLNGADLSFADLNGANLSSADLTRANLSDANLIDDNLSDAYLFQADLSSANLSSADLSRADLRDANLTEANLTGANLSGVNLTGAEGVSTFEPAFHFEGDLGSVFAVSMTTDKVFLTTMTTGDQLLFTNPSDVFDPSNLSERQKVTAPQNADEWVSWFQRHPNLDTSQPVPVSVGGASRMRLDVTAASRPENYPRDLCGGEPCVPLYPLSDGSAILSYEDLKDRFIIVDVEGETVLIDVAARAEKFDAFYPKAQMVLDSVEWTGG